ncbi:sensor histidine kinase [Methylobacterium platani]|uniref:histidine kinase n=2 Tax=Methylobacterium platani TaxID=427683 RepID=A0A179S654_9HYPH|nr:HAMP domain-containing sensor histidine kinase [Methylobacterium platani]KMO17247.1 histidine kinase [Methylobacterium platani JCM 14648]OAS19987.1 histidine kinase [Methylobacterium platani]
MTGPIGSLRRRLLLGALALIATALVVAGLAIGLILARFVRGQIDSRLDAQIVSLVSGLEPGDPLRLSRDLDAPPFDRPGSGWTWQVRRGSALLGSASLAGRPFPLPEVAEAGDDRPRPAEAAGPRGEALLLRVLALPDGTVVAASAPRAALYGPLREAGLALAASLGVLGLCLAAGAVAQVRLGLQPLDRLRRDLETVRAGQRERVPEAQPAEVRPLAAAINALLDQNAAQLAQARTHVANLAHGLKTPLATLSLALSEPGRDPDGRLGHLVGSLDRGVRHHLRRARSAALTGATRLRTGLSGPVSDLAATLERLHAGKGVRIAHAVPPGLAAACDPQDLDEMLGNLIDNACTWCAGAVRVSAEGVGGDVVVTIEDDGPGLGPEALAAVAQRGRRLDETVPGHGFGLAITTELAELYGGGLDLDRSAMGGLRARLRLPG